MKLDSRIHYHDVEGGSNNPAIRLELAEICAVKSCMVLSDSDHSYEHTFPEMEYYSKLVSPGQYLVVEDTNVYQWNGWTNIYDKDETAAKRGPMEAANDFAQGHPEFARTDWCTGLHGLTQQPNGWFYRTNRSEQQRV
ncbi:unnamed protein product [Polarella glacialis]|uniref:Rhamnosyl O-methyltransferase n=1 Tax=Polarella glacialis TaxID=89957 RepID=A0A813GNJ2_POLGL|nr:unnamed protein product [Polarella glacialis]